MAMMLDPSDPGLVGVARARARRALGYFGQTFGLRGDEPEALLDWAPDIPTALSRAGAEGKVVLLAFGVSALGLPASGFT